MSRLSVPRVRQQINQNTTYMVWVVRQQNVQLASEWCHGPEVCVETNLDPQMQKSNVDHAEVSKCQGAQDETGRWPVEQRVLERDESNCIADSGEDDEYRRADLKPAERRFVLPERDITWCRCGQHHRCGVDVFEAGGVMRVRCSSTSPVRRRGRGLTVVLPGTRHVRRAVWWRRGDQNGCPQY